MADKKNDDIIEQMSPSRRDFVRKSVKAGFIAPVIGTFTMSGLMSRPAAAQSNMSPPPG